MRSDLRPRAIHKAHTAETPGIRERHTYLPVAAVALVSRGSEVELPVLGRPGLLLGAVHALGVARVRRRGAAHVHPARHAEVQDGVGRRVELQPEVLALAARGHDAASGQRGLEGRAAGADLAEYAAVVRGHDLADLLAD